MAFKIGVAVLGCYDFRSKQAYIYRTNSIKEIVGASHIITVAYDRFLNLLSRKGFNVKKNYTFDTVLNCYINDVTAAFPSNEELDGEVIYVGGGCLYIIWRDNDKFVEANKILSMLLLKNTYSLAPVCGHAIYTGDYSEDMQNLHRSFNEYKDTAIAPMPTAILPFTEYDRKTSLPIAKKDTKKMKSYSQESVHKLKSYDEMSVRNTDMGETLLDELVYEKGTESLLAVIYIDGNNMGARLAEAMRGKNDYGDAVNAIRVFSNNVQSSYVTEPIDGMRNTLSELGRAGKYRLIVGGGDEITLICGARDAWKLVSAYFGTLSGENTACAGIAIFHSHSPFSVVYKIAEECCEKGKKRNRQTGGNNSFIDFHFCFSGITNDFEKLRSIQEEAVTNRPYCLSEGIEGTVPVSTFTAAAAQLKLLGRSNIKALRDSVFRPTSFLEMELLRIKSNEPRFTLTTKDMKAIFDASMMYDIWFREEEAFECTK